MSFIKENIFLTNNQKKKIGRGLNIMAPVKLKLTKGQLTKTNNLIPIMLTKTQRNKFIKSIKDKKGMMLNLSMSQLKANKKDGGILPFLIPIAVAGATALATGALSALGGLAVNKISDALDGKGLTPFGTGLTPFGTGLSPFGGNIMNQGLPPGVPPNDISLMPIGGQMATLRIGGQQGDVCMCGRGFGQGLFPIGVPPSSKRN